jgi:hypothetical protein
MIPGMVDPKMIEQTIKIMDEAIKDKTQVNLIINNRAGDDAPPSSSRRSPIGSARKSKGVFPEFIFVYKYKGLSE